MSENPDVSSAPTQEELSLVSNLGQRMFDQQQEVVRLEAELKRAQAALRQTAETDLPDALEEVGMTALPMKDFTLELEDVLSVKPPAANKPTIHKLLREQGHGAKIKRTVVVDMGKASDEQVEEVTSAARSQGKKFKLEEKVEPSTLKKHVKDALEAGQDVDLELFGVYQARRAKFTAGAPESPEF